MKFIKKNLLSLLCIALALFACNKESGSNTEQLTSGYWKVKDITFDDVNGSTFGDVDAELADYSDCADDIEIVFKSEGDWTFSDGGSCVFEDAYNNSGTWTFSPDEKTINLENGSFDESWSILELTKSTLKVKFYDCTSCGGQYSVSFDATVTYSH